MTAQGSPSGPIFVVGQPRSGSTITTRLLNETEDLFVLNDFYALQAIDAEDLWERDDASAATRIAEIVFNRLEIRATQEKGKTLNQSIDLSGEAIYRLREIATRPWPPLSRWNFVVSTMLSEAARLAGCSRWGWNTPQDHLHLDRLMSEWPDAQILFVLRSPADVLRSYKNVSGPWHDARRYNPATIGLAWKVAARNYVAWRSRRPDQTMLLRYEDLIANPVEATSSLANFLGTRIKRDDLSAFGRNSSYDGNREEKLVTPAEIWLAEAVIGESLDELSFARESKDFTLAGVTELSRILLGSGAFILKQIITDKDRRSRALNFVRRKT